MTTSTSYRLGVLVAVGTAAFLLLGIGALGIIGAGGRPDLLYVAALAVGVVGAVLARFRARGMARALGAAAVATLLVGVVAIALGWHEEPGASLVDIVGLTLMYAALFALSAWLFARAVPAGAAAGAT
jgi:hypothetical protein